MMVDDDDDDDDDGAAAAVAAAVDDDDDDDYWEASLISSAAKDVSVKSLIMHSSTLHSWLSIIPEDKSQRHGSYLYYYTHNRSPFNGSGSLLLHAIIVDPLLYPTIRLPQECTIDWDS